MTGPARGRVYDPVPDLARLLRVLEHSTPIGEPYPGSAHDLLRQIRAGLGVGEPRTAAEYEKALYGQLQLLPSGHGEGPGAASPGPS